MSKFNSFMEKMAADSALSEKYNALLAKHEPTRNLDAFITEVSELARGEGFDFSPNEFRAAHAPKGKLSEEQLEDVSGAGSGLALCIYTTHWLLGQVNVYNVKKDSSGNWRAKCPESLTKGSLCTWVGCRCWNLKERCVDGFHKCNEDGSPVFGHDL